MKKLSLIFLGTTGAGPVYSLEMAKAIAALGEYQMQIVISSGLSNLIDWTEHFSDTDVKIDIVNTYRHNKWDFIISLLRFWRVKKIVSVIKDFNPDCLYVPFLLTWDFLIYPRLYKNMRIIATLHDPHPHDVTRNPFARWIRYQNMKAYKYVSDVIVLNTVDLPYVKEKYCPNVHVIPHASFTYYVNKFSSDRNLKNTIGFLGRIEPYKGLDLLVDAFYKLDKKYKLLIAGEGKIDDNIYSKISSNNRIELINRYIDDTEFSDLLSKMDFVVLPYKRASQSGVIPLVFAHGKPVVVTNVGALKEQVPEGTGVITKPAVESIVSSISSLYENPNLIFEYGDNARNYAETELTWEHSAKLLINILDNNR